MLKQLKVMKVELAIKFNSREHAIKWYKSDGNAIAQFGREVLTQIDFSLLALTMETLKDKYGVTDIRIQFEKTIF